MTDPAIIEAAARALRDNLGTRVFEAEHAAKIVLAAVTPLIRAAALEEAAKVADAEAQEYAAHSQLKAEGKQEEALIYARYTIMAKTIAAAIRALKEQP